MSINAYKRLLVSADAELRADVVGDAQQNAINEGADGVAVCWALAHSVGDMQARVLCDLDTPASDVCEGLVRAMRREGVDVESVAPGVWRQS